MNNAKAANSAERADSAKRANGEVHSEMELNFQGGVCGKKKLAWKGHRYIDIHNVYMWKGEKRRRIAGATAKF